jgi:hypothetical protein
MAMFTHPQWFIVAIALCQDVASFFADAIMVAQRLT